MKIHTTGLGDSTATGSGRRQGFGRIALRLAIIAPIVAAALVVWRPVEKAKAASNATPLFVETTDAAGVTFTEMPAPDTPSGPMNGGGSVGDFNDDGWPDIFVLGGGLTPDRLFINNKNGTFTDQAAAWGLTQLYRGTGATAGDYDKDGCEDIFVTNMGDMPGAPAAGQHKLYHNNCNGHFTNVAVAAGVNQTASYPTGYGAAFGDYDLDGQLDLFVTGWNETVMGSRLTEGNNLFRNNGDGTFTDVTAAAGLPLVSKTRGFGAIFADMDGDRYPELLISGDFGTSKYYHNNTDGTFTGTAILLPGSDKVHNGMGTTIADVNRDGKQDWFITAIFPAWAGAGPNGNRLYMNKGNNKFQGLLSQDVNDGGWGWGAAALDYDNDGWIDLIHTNGWPNVDPITGGDFRHDTTRVFHNNTHGSFTDVAAQVGIVDDLEGRGLYQLDYDRDGKMDVVILHNADRLMLFHNELTGTDTNWLAIKIETKNRPALAPQGYGTNVRIRKGATNQYYRINGGSNYLGRGQLLAHFGTRNATILDEVVATFADGSKTTLTNVLANQYLTIKSPKP